MRLQDGHILPTVRIQKIQIENFKSVHNGTIVFNCGRKTIPHDTEADILGIYGQNGSGKTSIVEALAILKRVMSGQNIAPKYSECISKGAEYAKLAFTFDFQYEGENEDFSRTIIYSFKMSAIPNEKYENPENEDRLPYDVFFPYKVLIFDEIIQASGAFYEKKSGSLINRSKHEILNTTIDTYPIGPVSKTRYYVGKDRDAVQIDLAVNKKTALKDSRSFLFMDETMEIFGAHSENSVYYQILMELKNYAGIYLYAVDTRTSGIGAVSSVPFNTRFGVLGLNLLGTTRMSQKVFSDLEYFINGINNVLPTLITGMELVLEHSDIKQDSIAGQEVKLFSKRKDTLIPLRDESAGIIKIVSVLSLIIATYNDRSITVAIDELDAGIYEHLLGEILEGLETYGKGQFIFTSHNLRPLEILKKESIIFTTANPDNRYIRLKGVGRTNNLRDLYLRSIRGNSQDEVIYDAAKKQRMIAAFMKAGDGFAEEK